MKRVRYSASRVAAWFLEHGGQCHICGQKIHVGQVWEREHVIPLAQGGSDELDNQRPAHAVCHKGKTAKDAGDTARAKRREAAYLGIKKPKARPLPGSKASGWKRKMDGTIVRRGKP